MYKRINTKHDSLNLPYIVLIPKLHKDPFKFRTVTMAYNTYNIKASKILQEEIGKIEDYIIKHEKNYIIKNSHELIQKITKIQKNNNINSMTTLDFKELFDNICQETAEKILNDLYKKYKSKINFKLDEIEYNFLVKQLIYNNYIMFGGEIFKQIKGIPQGLPSSNIISNLVLHNYEKNIKTEILMMRYIDDVIAFNINNKNIFSCYPEFLSLIETNGNDHKKGSFLDLTIKIENDYINYDIYNKQLCVEFEIINNQKFQSNLHINIYKNILVNNFIRIDKLCSQKNKQEKIKMVCQKAIKAGFPTNFVNKIRLKYINNMQKTN